MIQKFISGVSVFQNIAIVPLTERDMTVVHDGTNSHISTNSGAEIGTLEMRSTIYWLRRLKCVRIWNVVDAANAILVFTQKPRNSFSDTWAFVWFQVISSSATTQHALHEKHRKWRNCVKLKPLKSSRAVRRNDLALGIPDKFRLTLAVTLFLARKVESHSSTSTFDSFQTFVRKGNDHRKDGQKYWHKWR